MVCVNCNKQFYVQRTFLTLFSVKKYYICDSCRKEYPLKMRIEHIPLEIYEAEVISLFSSKYRLNFNAYILEIEKIVSYFVMHHPHYFLLFLDFAFFSDLWLEQLNFIAEAEQKSLLIICLQMRN